MAYVEKRIRNGVTTWRARYRDPANRLRTRTFDRKTDAERFLHQIETTKVRGEWVDPRLGKTTCGDYISAWLATKADVARSTKLNIDGRVAKHIRPFFEDMPVNAVRATHARAFVAELVSSGLSPSTVKSITLTASQVFAQAVDDGLIARSPFANVGLPSQRQHEEMHFLTADQVNNLAAAIDERFRPAIYVAAYGGLRAGELWALRVDRVNVLGRTVEIVESASLAGGWHVGPTKTGKRRTVAVPRFLADMIGEHIGRYASSRGLVFSAAEGGPVNHRNFSRRHYRNAVKRAVDVPNALRFHDLRHTCAAFLIAEGRHMEEVKDYLGHSSIRVTSDRYGHLFPAARAEIAEALDARFRGSTLAAAPQTRPTGTLSTLSRRGRAAR
jgi:integrase